MKTLTCIISVIFLVFITFGCQQAAEKADAETPVGDTAWHEVGTSGEPQFLNSWGNSSIYETCGFKKDGFGFIHLKGRASGGTSSTTIYYLPEGYRPNHTLYIGNSTTYVQIGTNGAVLGNSTTIFLDGISF